MITAAKPVNHVSNLSGEMTQAEMMAELQALKAQNAAMQAQLAAKPAPTAKKPKFGIGPAGGLVIYLGGTYPKSFNIGEWDKFVTIYADACKFVEDNRSSFKVLSDEERAAKAKATRERLKATLPPKTA